MMKYKFGTCILLLFLGLHLNSSNDSQHYTFINWHGPNLKVYYAKPPKINKATRLVVVMHGRKRNAEEYRDQWIESSNKLNLFVIVPEYTENNFPSVWGFNYGNIKTESLENIEPRFHAFAAIEPMVDDAIKKFKIRSNKWGIYGHGAGAHFVHRYILHNPEASHSLAIAANLGWYLSMTDQTWPFGLQDSDVTNEKLKKAFGRYFLLLLGKSDLSTKPNSPYVSQNFEIIKMQGKHRLERGRNFFSSVIKKSKDLGIFLKWGMVEAPTKDGHSNTKQMVPYAAELFYSRLK